ncbi:tape measure protein [Anaerococcus murdochii]|uniref:Tape measure protein n=1 Tax=Anaerococcus murdochii TaxID=411577 RepID=A0ABS7T1Z4_9FIRM|nr:tape measure protein [Anaerococcus murdochii]MBZ2387778.1 tape measure protein [Anaerococcus murdochii]
MAIIEKVTLVDDYSAKAKKIEASTSAMASAMDAIRGNASKMGSALKSAFSRKYSVDIKDTGVANVNNRIKSLQSTLNGLNRPYDITITAKMGAMDKIKSNMSSIKSKASEMKSSFRNFKLDYSTFKRAKKEAKDMEKALRNLTGRKHKIDIGMENPIKTAFKGGFSKMFGGLKAGFSKIGGLFSKLNPFKAFGKGGGGGGGESPSIMKSIIGGNLITGAITRGLGAVTSLAGSTIGAGMTRLENIQAAKARLRGQTNADGSRKFDDAAIKNISKSAMNAVTGTAYGFGDAMSTASSAIAAGVKEKDLGGYLKGVANISAATGSDFNSIGAIMNKIQTTGRLQGDELMQLSDRGLPMLEKIAEMKGVDQNTARDMISKGQISSQDAFKAATMAAGNSASEMNKTWDAAKMNFGSALSKLGAGLLGGSEGDEGGIFVAMTPALLKVNKVLNGLIPTFQKVGDSVKTFVTGGFKMAKEGFGRIKDKLGEAFGPIKEKLASAFDALKEAFAPVVEAFSGLFDGGMGESFDLLGGVIDLVAGAFGVLADVIVALNPVWEVLSSFITNIVLPAFTSVASFITDTVVPKFSELAEMVGGWVKEAFQLIGDAVNIAKAAFDTIKGAIDTAVDAFFSIPSKIASALGGLGGAIKGAIGGIFGGKKKNATGTSYFPGGLTQINEQGQEMMKLPMGTKIYPAGATRKAIEKEARSVSPAPQPSNPGQIVINVNGANMTNGEVGRVISNELKRLGVVV